MTARLFYLVRHKDLTGKSGEGIVAEGVEWSGGTADLHWLTDWETFVHWPGGVEDILAVHGHEGATVARWLDGSRLEQAYRAVMPYLLESGHKPVKVGPHPDHPDRLHVVFAPSDEAGWRRWVALFDGSTFAATHEEVNGEIEHRWISSDGNLWLSYFTVAPGVTTEDLMAGESYPNHDEHLDPRD